MSTCVERLGCFREVVRDLDHGLLNSPTGRFAYTRSAPESASYVWGASLARSPSPRKRPYCPVMWHGEDMRCTDRGASVKSMRSPAQRGFSSKIGLKRMKAAYADS